MKVSSPENGGRRTTEHLKASSPESGGRRSTEGEGASTSAAGAAPAASQSGASTSSATEAWSLVGGVPRKGTVVKGAKYRQVEPEPTRANRFQLLVRETEELVPKKKRKDEV